MTPNLGHVPTHTATLSSRPANGRTPPGHRVLHVIVPEPIFNHVKAQAYLSGLRFPEYVAHVLKNAAPYTAPALTDDTAPAPTP